VETKDVVKEIIQDSSKPEKLKSDLQRRTSLDEIDALIRARYPIIWIVSFEEDRVLKKLRDVKGVYGKKVFQWTITEGWQGAGAGEGKDLTDPLKALNWMVQTEKNAVFFLKDFHPYLQDPSIVRRLRDLREQLKNTTKTCILLSSVLKLPPELEKEVAVVDFELPDVEQLAFIRDGVLQSVANDPRVESRLDERQKEKIAEAALGLTAIEAENVFAKSIVQHKKFDIDVILQEKEQIIRKSGILEFMHPEENVEGIGGLELLKTWLKKRTKAFTKEARAFGLPQPKGILLIGVPGCGKSLTAKSVGNLWQLPLLRLDVGRVFGSLVGSSEENIRRAIRTAESVAPCILWLDELEKGLSGVQSSGATDGGTTSRVFGTFITWLQEKTSPVFVIATANQVKLLPPEILRKGRFDEIFFVDLPSAEERKEIFKIHIKKRATASHPRNIEDFDLNALVEASEGYSGAEIEQSVISALYDAFDAGMDLNTEGLLQSLEETVPLSQTMQEEITSMREWAKTRARFASVESLREKGETRKLEL
jgi:SpoVK/Ycf46/Vps4 family AAA+-type ATPase